MTSNPSPRPVRTVIEYAHLEATIDYANRAITICTEGGGMINVHMAHVGELTAILEAIGHQAPGG